MLTKNRKFYDLCRKYKYYYKAYKEVEHLKDIYWSQYIRQAYNEVKEKLEETEKEMMDCMFESFDLELRNISIDISRNIDPYQCIDSPFVPCLSTKTRTSIKGEGEAFAFFAKRLVEYLYKNR